MRVDPVIVDRDVGEGLREEEKVLDSEGKGKGSRECTLTLSK